ncbi:hypothetical protein [Nocardioides psychrotolerans]|nr:hypothetical protein [Nocardioides psychrotolerans]
MRTHSGWTYDAIDAGAYVWRSPHRLHFRRGHHGITPITTRTTPPGET